MVPKVLRLRGSSETHTQGRILPTQLLRTSRGRPRGDLSGLRHQDELVDWPAALVRRHTAPPHPPRHVCAYPKICYLHQLT